MPNKEKGEVGFEYENEQYILRYDFNAFCEMEDLLQKPVDQILASFETGNRLGFRELRKVFLAGLNVPASQAQTFNRMTIEERLKRIGNMIQDMGGIVPATGKILESVSASFPETTEEDETEKKQAAAAGTGSNS